MSDASDATPESHDADRLAAVDIALARSRAAPRSERDLSGTVLAERYEILERIGAGGMGEVYRARHRDLPKQVAIKVLGQEFTSRPEPIERFLNEARASSLIRHENIVDITDFGHDDAGLPFFVMELLEGESLRATIEREAPMPWARVRAIM
ncbi:MAG: protein kinase, partial [Myxococcales bacterium]|nr:protein kinase [Myxococcales bacterium]